MANKNYKMTFKMSDGSSKSVPFSVPSGGGANIDVVAEVGQTIVVEEVDADGKPTKWKAAEYQERTHWSEETVILPETTVDIDPEVGAAVLPELNLVGGREYTVKYNGVEYVRMCDDIGDGMFGLGNYGIIISDNPIDTGEPFGIVRTPMEYDENDNPIFGWIVFPCDGSTTVTLEIGGKLYTTVPPDYLPDGVGYTEVVEVVPETEAINSDEGTYYVEANKPLVAGATYTIKWNGATFVCKALPTNTKGIISISKTIDGQNLPFVLTGTTYSKGIMINPYSTLESPPVISIVGSVPRAIPEKYVSSGVLYVNGYNLFNNGGNVWCFEHISHTYEQIEEAVVLGKSVVIINYDHTNQCVEHYVFSRKSIGGLSFVNVDTSIQLIVTLSMKSNNQFEKNKDRIYRNDSIRDLIDTRLKELGVIEATT